jgi:putative chitinase
LEVQKIAIASILLAAEKYELTDDDTFLTLAIARIESGFNPDVATKEGSGTGLGLINDQVAERFGMTDVQSRFDVFENAEALVKLTQDNKRLVDKRMYFGDELLKAIYGYHKGGNYSESIETAEKEILPLIEILRLFNNSSKKKVLV